MQRQSRSQYHAQHELFRRQTNIRNTQRRLYMFKLVSQRFADFVGKYFAQTFQISAETHTVLLNVDVAHLSQKFVKNRICFVKFSKHFIMID